MANAASYFVDRHVAEGRGDKVAFREVGTGRSLTYGALAEASGRAAAALLAAVLPDPKGRSARQPSAFVERRARAIADGAATIAADGRAACFQPD